MTVHYLYRILLPDGRAYIGVSMRPERRFSDHCRADSYVGAAIRRHGAHNCEVQILCAGSKDYIYDLEERAIKTFNTWAPYGYNRRTGIWPEFISEGRARFLNSLRSHHRPARLRPTL